MIGSQSILVEVYHREKSRWTLSRYGLQDEVEIESLGIRFFVRNVYQKTSLTKATNTER